MLSPDVWQTCPLPSVKHLTIRWLLFKHYIKTKLKLKPTFIKIFFILLTDHLGMTEVNPQRQEITSFSVKMPVPPQDRCPVWLVGTALIKRISSLWSGCIMYAYYGGRWRLGPKMLSVHSFRSLLHITFPRSYKLLSLAGCCGGRQSAVYYMARRRNATALNQTWAVGTFDEPERCRMIQRQTWFNPKSKDFSQALLASMINSLAHGSCQSASLYTGCISYSTLQIKWCCGEVITICASSYLRESVSVCWWPANMTWQASDVCGRY